MHVCAGLTGVGGMALVMKTPMRDEEGAETTTESGPERGVATMVVVQEIGRIGKAIMQLYSLYLPTIVVPQFKVCVARYRG